MESTHNNGWHGVNFILALIAIIIIIILLIAFYEHRNDIELFGFGWRITNGTTTASTDSFIINSNSMYIGQSSQDVTLTLQQGRDFIGGVFGVKNNTTNTNITVVPASGVVVRANQVPVVAPGVFAEWVLTSTGYLRLDNPTAVAPVTPPSGSNVANSVGGVQNPLSNLVAI